MGKCNHEENCKLSKICNAEAINPVSVKDMVLELKQFGYTPPCMEQYIKGMAYKREPLPEGFSLANMLYYNGLCSLYRENAVGNISAAEAAKSQAALQKERDTEKRISDFGTFCTNSSSKLWGTIAGTVCNYRQARKSGDDTKALEWADAMERVVFNLPAFSNRSNGSVEEPILFPCPCCGGKANLVKEEDAVSVSCTKCGISTKAFDQTEDAIGSWNNRM